MAEEHRPLYPFEHVLGEAAEDQLAHAVAAVAAHHDQIGLGNGRGADQGLRRGTVRRCEAARFDIEPMPAQLLRQAFG
jgi:hypothetical protein